MTRPIPPDPEGYAVTDDGIVHTRYSRHAHGSRRSRSMAGAYAIAGPYARPCDACYPVPEPAPEPIVKRRRAIVPPGFGVSASIEYPDNVEPVAPEDIPVEGEVEA